MDKKAVGRRIKEYREKSGLTQEALAEMVSLSPGYLSSVERGVGFPSVETLVAILNCIGASADEIFIDVVDNACNAKASLLSAKITDLPGNERRRILNVVETMIQDAEKDIKK